MSLYHILTLETDTENADITSGLLFDLGATALEEKEMGPRTLFKASFEAKSAPQNLLEEARIKLPQALSFSIESVDSSAAQFQPKPFDPLFFAGNTWIIPPEGLGPRETPVGTQTLTLLPGMGFGTGRHESTQLVAQAITHFVPQINSLLDVGTGSGILSLYAQKLGVPKIVAVEIDEQARENALENAQLNHMPLTLLDSIDKVTSTFDMLVANIITPIHLELKEHYFKLLKPKGILVISGITVEETAFIEKGFSSWHLLNREKKNEWMCYTFRRGNS